MTAFLPEGERVYAIGDIHGRLDLLDELLQRIDASDSALGDAHISLIFLGDLIDRGPDSCGVIERAMQLAEVSPSVRFLRGNHESVFLGALDGDPRVMRFFCDIGGRETLRSYGLDEDRLIGMTPEQIVEFAQALVPQRHLDFIRGFEASIEMGDYLFVHAGIRPGVPLDEQDPRDLMWIRDEFLRSNELHGKMIVHGHSIASEVEEMGNRIGIDTGAFSTGCLTAVGLEGAERWFIQTEPDGD